LFKLHDQEHSEERDEEVYGLTDRYKIHISRDPHDFRWDDFVGRCLDGHHEQTSLWSRIKKIYGGWDPVRIMLSNNGEIFGGAQILHKRTRSFGRIGYILRGPLAFSGEREALNQIARELDRFAENERFSLLIVVPSYFGNSFTDALDELDFFRKPDCLPPTGLLPASLMISVADDHDEILGRMRRTTRQEIRKSGREGMTVQEAAGEEDVETFRRLMYALCKRRGVDPHPPQQDFFRRLWEIFHPHGYVKILLVKYEETPVAAGLLFTFGSTVRFWKMGWTGDHEEKNPTNFLYWEAIKWTKAMGFRYFEIMGLDAHCARAMTNGEAIRPRSTDGMSFFKTGFGGEAVVVPDALCKFYSFIPRIFMHSGGKRILATEWAGRVLRRLHSSSED
jgi:peptidoglycan pentaglycine glycine transferase (the first glycine)